eukprot:CAMPEP_0172611060 /NCGR_PEP_ID=MMETSP1068-20121228/30780_1 /TAXON_ID=35684 /ORGANISM="Pseudopedinella elastica, Strain CCMP716" /LENGTH=355 /DNA_ID=CAMNT_0013414927 /DNA_START=195 /DNA_END=1262 /DNA_ORIENTATION=-
MRWPLIFLLFRAAVASDHEERVGVCITGQLARLELAIKARNILRPLSALLGPVDVAFVLSGLNSIRVEPVRAVDSTSSSRTKVDASSAAALFATSGDLQRAVGSLRAQGVVGNFKLVDHTQPREPVNPAPYTELLAAKRGTSSLERALLNMRQWENQMACYRELEDLAWMRKPNPKPHTLFLRLREDTILPDIFPAKAIQATLRDQSLAGKAVVMTTQYDHFNGINDKLSVFNREAAWLYFVAPFVDAYARPEAYVENTRRRRVRNELNVENAMAAIFDARGITLLQLPKEVYAAALRLHVKTGGLPSTEAASAGDDSSYEGACVKIPNVRQPGRKEAIERGKSKGTLPKQISVC